VLRIKYWSRKLWMSRMGKTMATWLTSNKRFEDRGHSQEGLDIEEEYSTIMATWLTTIDRVEDWEANAGRSGWQDEEDEYNHGYLAAYKWEDWGWNPEVERSGGGEWVQSWLPDWVQMRGLRMKSWGSRMVWRRNMSTILATCISTNEMVEDRGLIQEGQNEEDDNKHGYLADYQWEDWGWSPEAERSGGGEWVQSWPPGWLPMRG
jgi:hypothetical protein